MEPRQEESALVHECKFGYKSTYIVLALIITGCGGSLNYTNPSNPVINWNPPTTIEVGTTLDTTQLNATASVPGTFAYNPGAGTVLAMGDYTLTATFSPADKVKYNSTKVSANIKVTQKAAKISWQAPAPISAGTALGSTQLNATANVAGTFVYNPGAGMVLPAGVQVLSVTFTPSDTNNYAVATAQNQITVNQVSVGKATPVITWNAPASIMAGTALGANQLNASANVPGSFVYNPAAGTVLPAGTHALSVTFTPNDTTNYEIGRAHV